MSLVVLALGNDLLGDDGIGLMAADELRRRDILGVTIVKSPQSGLYLVDQVEWYDDLLVIDSISGENPGTVARLNLSDLKVQNVPCAHYLGLPEALELARRSGLTMPKRVQIVTIQIPMPQVIGAKMSPEVKNGLPLLIEEVLNIMREWGYEVDPWVPKPTTSEDSAG